MLQELTCLKLFLQENILNTTHRLLEQDPNLLEHILKSILKSLKVHHSKS